MSPSLRLLGLTATLAVALSLAEGAVNGTAATPPPPGGQSTCGLNPGWAAPTTTCDEHHICCAIDSGDSNGFCCPRYERYGEDPGTPVQCAFGFDGLGVGTVRLRNCCVGRPVCGVGVGAHYCCMGPVSKRSRSGCAAYGPPVCCNAMCGDELCDAECASLRGTCTKGTSADGGRCVDAAGKDIVPPVRL